MLETVAVIDGDSLCYICSKENISTSIKNIDSIIESIRIKTGASSYYLFISEGIYFRHNINNQYKAHRPISDLKYLKTLKSYLKEQYNALSFEGLEADDMNGLVMFNQVNPKKYKYINCSPDKDVKKQIAGEHYDYKKVERGVTSNNEAIHFLFKQLLEGDAGDNIKGLKGIGKVKSELILKDCKTLEHYYQTCLKQYIQTYGLGEGIHNFTKVFKQVYILRKPIDFYTNVGYIPELPTPFKFQTTHDNESTEEF